MVIGIILIVIGALGVVYFIFQADKKESVQAPLSLVTADPAVASLKAKKCKFCYTKLDETALVCTVCTLACNKDKKDLTKEEKYILSYCRFFVFMGYTSIIWGILVILASFFHIEKQLNVALFDFLIGAVMVYFGVSLLKYQKWCRIGGIILFIFIAFSLFFSAEFKPNFLVSTIAAFSATFAGFLMSKIGKKILCR